MRSWALECFRLMPSVRNLSVPSLVVVGRGQGYTSLSQKRKLVPSVVSVISCNSYEDWLRLHLTRKDNLLVPSHPPFPLNCLPKYFCLLALSGWAVCDKSVLLLPSWSLFSSSLPGRSFLSIVATLSFALPYRHSPLSPGNLHFTRFSNESRHS